MDYEKEISFGAFDSELMHQEITIPEGFEATIDGNKIILKKIESEDERIRKELIEHVKDQQSSFISAPDCRDKYEEEENNKYNSWLSWLEKQGTYTKKDVDDAFVEGMALAKNELEKQGEQKSIDDDMKEALRTEYEKGRAEAFAEMQKKWSDEDDDDDAWMNDIISKVENNLQLNKAEIDWFKSLKDRVVPQPKQEWSKEDEDYFDAIITKLEVTQEDAALTDNQLKFLKSLKYKVFPQNHWKPSKDINKL